MYPTVVTHSDCDGIFCLATLMKVIGDLPERKVHFSNPNRLISSIASSISENLDENKKLYIFDISGTREAMISSLVYEEVIWIDHHVWTDEVIEVPRLKVYVDNSAKSATQLVSKYFNIMSGFEKYADEIDTNSVRDEKASRMRSVLYYIKRKFDGPDIKKVMMRLAQNLAEEGITAIDSEEYIKMEDEYEKIAEKMTTKVREKVRIYTIKNLKVAIFESGEWIPAYIITNELENHEKSPFHIIVIIQRMDYATKCEFRTHTKYNVLSLATWFGGGGHKYAAGATLDRDISCEEILNLIKS